MRLIVAMLLVGTATPAFAQDHSGHAMPAEQEPAQTECEREAARHRAMGHPVPAGACAPVTQPTDPATGNESDGHAGMDHSQMDQSQMEGTRPEPVPAKTSSSTRRGSQGTPSTAPAPVPTSTASPATDQHAGHDMSTMSEEEMKAMGHD